MAVANTTAQRGVNDAAWQRCQTHRKMAPERRERGRPAGPGSSRPAAAGSWTGRTTDREAAGRQVHTHTQRLHAALQACSVV